MYLSQRFCPNSIYTCMNLKYTCHNECTYDKSIRAHIFLKVYNHTLRLQKLCKLKILSKSTIILLNAICSVSFVSNTLNLQDTNNYRCCTWSWKDDACEVIFVWLDIKTVMYTWTGCAWSFECFGWPSDILI